VTDSSGGKLVEAENPALLVFAKDVAFNSPGAAAAVVFGGNPSGPHARRTEPVLRECLSIRDKALPDDWPRFNTMSQLGGALLGQARYAEAEPIVVSGYEGLKAREAKVPAVVRSRLSAAAAVRVIRLYEAWNRPERAREWKEQLGLADLPADVFTRP
jgi:hypothetical protein